MKGKGFVLVIAGSDSSGGAGTEADLKVIAAHRCYGMTATTALTAQNTTGVYGINYTPPDFVRKQIDVCLTDIDVDVVKTGMLASAQTIDVVALAIQKYQIRNIVIDPVMVSTSGSRLLEEKAVTELRSRLLPLATVLTPNVPEAKMLLADAGHTVKDLECVEDLIDLAKAVQALGPKYVLLKGGHIPFKKNGTIASTEAEKELMVDVLCDRKEVIKIEAMYQSSKNTHGTGCSLASAIASNLANGMEVPRAVKAACRYVEAGIRTATDLGSGNGPINHFHSTYTLPFAPGRFLEYLLEHPDVQDVWREHTEHDFVARLGDGTLSVEAFKYYLIQDYLYLIQFARANALASYKANTMEDIAASAKVVAHIHHEMELHIEYCKGFGISLEDILASKESQACTAYTRYVLDVGQSQDWFALQVSMAPCLIGYGIIARRLHDNPKTKREGNIYWKWIQNYVADDYTEAVAIGSLLLERHAVLQSSSRIEDLVQIFIHATKMETGFWDMGAGYNKEEK